MIEKQYFVRHGQTDWNKDKKLMGRADIPLNEAGRKQARETRDRLKDVSFSAIVTSPLSRAYETGEIIAELHPNTPFIVAEELAERDFGDFEGKVNDGNYFGQWEYNLAATPNGETPKDLYERIKNFLERINHQYSGTILLVTHGGVGLMIEAYHKGIPEDGDLLRYVAGNGEIKIYDIEGRDG